MNSHKIPTAQWNRNANSGYENEVCATDIDGSDVKIKERMQGSPEADCPLVRTVKDNGLFRELETVHRGLGFYGADKGNLGVEDSICR